ncbi:hypothetical protein V8B55DRAFT_1411025 [Mucor lusitanicus]
MSSPQTPVVKNNKDALVGLFKAMIEEGDENAAMTIVDALKIAGLQFARLKGKTHLFALPENKMPVISNEIKYATKKYKSIIKKRANFEQPSSSASDGIPRPSKKQRTDPNDDSESEYDPSEASAPSSPSSSVSPVDSQPDKHMQPERRSASSDTDPFDKLRAALDKKSYQLVNEGNKDCSNLPNLPTVLKDMEDARPFISQWQSNDASREYLDFLSNINSIALFMVHELGKKLNPTESIVCLVTSAGEKEALRKRITYGRRMLNAMSKYGFIAMLTPIFNNSNLCRISESNMNAILGLCEEVHFKESLKNKKLFIAARPSATAFVQNMIEMINAKSPKLLEFFVAPNLSEHLAIENNTPA